MSVIIFLIILAILILVHEFGHFIVAKKSGIRVDEFGLGFPPKIFAKKWGGTLYTLNAIPFGGFVKIFGEDSHGENISEKDKSTSFVYKSKWIQAAVLVAGVTFNMIFAWLLISIGFMIGIQAPENYSNFGQVKDMNLVITDVMPGSPAEKAGLLPGDAILSITDYIYAATPDEDGLGEFLGPPQLDSESFRKFIISHPEERLYITYKRDDTGNYIKIIPKITNDQAMIGVSVEQIGTLKLPIHSALIEGLRTTWFLTKATAVGLGNFLWNIVVFKSDFSQVAGPVGIAKVVGDAAGVGFTNLLSLVALISINLAIINLLPFPALDGGRLLFVVIEAIIRRPIKPRTVKFANTLGFSLLIVLMIVVTGHDILKLI